MEKTTLTFLLTASYLASSVLFILGLRGLNSPETARRGMNYAASGMALAIIGTLFVEGIVDYLSIIIGLVIGSAFGVIIAILTPMTKMPERTAFSHACGALAVTLVGIAKYYHHNTEMDLVERFAVNFEVLFGALTTTGSIIAMGKLQGFVKGTPVTFPGQNAFNVTLFAVIFGMFGYLTYDPSVAWLFYTMVGLSLVFGIMLVMPIGSADMPVVISLLNSYAGLACVASGFALNNNVLIIGGALDGASGFILSILMTKAMNRSMVNVLFGAFGKAPSETGALPAQAQPTAALQAQPETKYHEIKVEACADLFRAAKKVIVVPGYGMAVAQAQHVVREFSDLLKEKDISVKYAIHPVAGRLPGHMNVPLAEANVPYDELVDMDDINPEFPEADVALVIGANDVTNPAAKDNPTSPIYGMPILDVEQAKHTVVIKRSMNAGFAGIENDLYYKPKTSMFFGDARKAMQSLISEYKAAEESGREITTPDTLMAGVPGVKEIKVQEAAEAFKRAKSVIIVPGYGMAAAQAQHGVRELADLLKERGCKLRYAIHPVAGRMPGHMNVLLAEANVPYDELIDMDDINPDFPTTDIAVIVGANDVVNPAATNNPGSPIYGMPILEAYKAKRTIVLKRSMNAGFAGIENELFYAPNNFMLFGDAKATLGKVVGAMKDE